MNASSIPAATPASQPEAAEPSSNAEQQLPAQLRHRGHAEPPLGSEAAGDESNPMQAPQPGAATMSREARELSDADVDGKAAKLAAVAKGQANSSEVCHAQQHMPPFVLQYIWGKLGNYRQICNISIGNILLSRW